MDKNSNAVQPLHPLDGNAGFFSKLTFGWLTPIISLGNTRELELEDIYAVEVKYTADELLKKVNHFVDIERKKKKPRFEQVVFQMIREQYCEAIVLAVPYLLFFALQPKFIRALLLSLEGKEDPWFPGWPGIAHAVCLPLCTALMGVTMQHMWSRLLRTAARVRSFGMAYVFKKALNLAPHARQDYSVGSLVTLMSVDLERLFYWVHISNFCILSPAMIVIVCSVVVTELGILPSLAGFAVLIALSLFQYFTAVVLKRARVKVMDHTENRIHLIEELLQGIRVIKAYAWEGAMARQVEGVRKKELRELSIMLLLLALNLSVMFITPVAVGMVCFYVYALQGNVLTASTVFTAFAAINLLRLPIKVIPMVVARGVEAYVSYRRLTMFMCLDELEDSQLLLRNWDSATDSSITAKQNETVCVEMKDCVFAWSPDAESFKVNIKDMELKKGSLCCVIGKVGSGKSSLLSCILGEMIKVQGSGMKSKTSYVAQKAWIQNSSLREAILFGRPFAAERYNAVIKMAELEADLNVLPNRDATEIGERGINLSGGQKQRVAIARALYCSTDVDLCLFDDPLSAVDVHVAMALFENAICGPMLSEKTRILTLNSHYHLLPRADLIIVMQDGNAIGCAPYDEIKGLKEFQELAEGQLDEEVSMPNTPKKRTPLGSFGSKEEHGSTVDLDSIKVDPANGGQEKATTLGSGKLVQKEDRVMGSVSWKTFVAYYSAASSKNGLCWGIFVFSTFVVGQTLRTVDDALLSLWSENSTDTNLTVLYGVFAGLTFVFYVTSSSVFMWSAVCASRVFHKRIFEAILQAPINKFYDVTRVGTILNRFTKDVDNMDMLLPDYQIQFIQNSLYFISASLLCIVANPMFGFCFPVLFGIFVLIGRYYRSSLRSLKRIESVSRSPIFSSFTEAMNGLATIRAFTGVKSRTLQNHYDNVDKNSSIFDMYWTSGNWFALRVDLIGATIVCCVSILSVTAKEYGQQSPAMIGLALTFAIQFTSLLQWTVRCAIETESNMTSVERLNFYADSIPKEAENGDAAPTAQTGNISDQTWPAFGEIELIDVKMKYRDGLPLILKGLSMKIKGGEKIGVVGRTGAGKSSLVLSFLRLVELDSGSIMMDGVDISTLSLKTLRSVVSLIPQSPFLFTGTLRLNLDPFEEYTDEQVWKVLDLCNLKDTVQSFDLKLKHKIADQGSNLSAGQQQLVCIGRALLRGSKIILLDEATANVDHQTDQLIQQTMKSAFSNATTITIAHRLDTVVESDRVMVLDDGIIAEFDSPETLMKNKNGAFYQLMKEWQEKHRNVQNQDGNV
jgi:ATP-binding cassette, subfamily C (CFTR/MRP), member 1